MLTFVILLSSRDTLLFCDVHRSSLHILHSQALNSAAESQAEFETQNVY